MLARTHGFTLIELLVAVAIVGLLVALLIPSLLSARARANDASAAGCAKELAASQEIVFLDTSVYASSLAALNGATDGMAGNCHAAWVDDSEDFTDGWAVEHPNGSGVVYRVGPGGIIPSP